MKLKLLPILLILSALQACNSSGSNKKTIKHNYPKYWEKYTDKELEDLLYADTLHVGTDSDGGNSSTKFYKERIKKLLIELKRDKNKVDHLYPMGDFDEVTLSNGILAAKKSFTDEQTARFLALVNDPTSFNWSETTSEPDIQVSFLRKGKIVGILNVEANKSVVKPMPELYGYTKMKFGSLNKDARRKLVKLLAEVGL